MNHYSSMERKSRMASMIFLFLALVNVVSAFAPHRQNFALQRATHFGLSQSALFMSAAPANVTVATSTSDGNAEVITLQGSQLKPKPVTLEHGPVRAIHSIEEFLDALENTEENELVVVKIHAKFCKVCHRVILKFKKMAHTFGLPGANPPVPIRFISVEAMSNPKIIEQLGVKKFPFLQIYRNRECVASFGTGPAHNFQTAVGGTVKQKLNMPLEEWEAFRTEFKSEISSGLENLELLRIHAAVANDCTDKVNDKSVSP